MCRPRQKALARRESQSKWIYRRKADGDGVLEPDCANEPAPLIHRSYGRLQQQRFCCFTDERRGPAERLGESPEWVGVWPGVRTRSKAKGVVVQRCAVLEGQRATQRAGDSRAGCTGRYNTVGVTTPPAASWHTTVTGGCCSLVCWAFLNRVRRALVSCFLQHGQASNVGGG